MAIPKETSLALPLPDLLSVYQAEAVYGVSQPGLTRLREHIHHLELPRSLYRYPLGYAVLLRYLFDPTHPKTKLDKARNFGVTEAARFTMQAAEEALDGQITRATDEEGLIPSGKAAGILNLGRVTLTNWRDRGDVEVVTRTIENKPRLFVPAGALREVCVWNYPEEFIYDTASVELNQPGYS